LDGDFDATSKVRVPLVIQATGRASGIVGRGLRRTTDRLIALLTYGSIAPGITDQRLLIEACDSGWWYAAPLPRNGAVLAFMTDPDFLPSSCMERAAFVEAKLRSTSLISLFATQMKAPKRHFGCSANSGIREQIYGDNWIFVGDAASTYDPLLGKGLALALAKGTAISRLVSSCSDLRRAFSEYADAEHAVFADFRANQRRTYRRAAERFGSPFWERRCA
jgi:flavin-dependent dehydrogenase